MGSLNLRTRNGRPALRLPTLASLAEECQVKDLADWPVKNRFIRGVCLCRQATAGLVAYYLLWKYVVGFVNRVLGIA